MNLAKYQILRMDGKFVKSRYQRELDLAKSIMYLLNVPACIIRVSDRKILVRNYWTEWIKGMPKLIVNKQNDNGRLPDKVHAEERDTSEA